MTRLRLVLALLFLLPAAPVAAQALSNLGEVTVAVEDQSDAARESAFSDAVGTVLVRLTGRPDVADAEAVEGIVERAGRYVQQFRYGRDADGDRELMARFDTEALREALVRAEVPVWQRDRPPLLVWLAVERGDRRELVSSEQGEAERAALLEAAGALGVPLLFPLMDLEDQRRVDFADVAGGFDDPVLEASERYDTPVVLAGRLRGTGRGPEVRWILYGPDGQRERWRATGEALEELADDTLQRVAEVLREPYTLLPDLERSTVVRVHLTGIEGLEDFAAAEDLLGGLGGVRGVRPDEVNGKVVRFRLAINVDRERVVRALERESRLQPATLPDGLDAGVGVDDAQVYRLRR